MGFVHDFGARPRQQQPAPQRPSRPPVEQRPPGRRGFFVDFNPQGAELAAGDYYRPSEPVEPDLAPAPLRRWSSSRLSGVGLEQESSSTPQQDTTYSRPFSSPSPRKVSWSPSVTRSTVAPKSAQGPAVDVSSLEWELRSLSERMRSLSSSGDGSSSKVADLEQELSRTKAALAEAKQDVERKRGRYQWSEKALERSRRIVSRLEMRMSGYGSSGGWGGYGGGGRWGSRYDDEFLFTRAELRGSENAEERQHQMALMLDSRRERVWALQDKVSNARAALMTAESKVRELENRLTSLGSELEQARRTRSDVLNQKSATESKLAQLKQEYNQLTGRYW